MALSPEQPFVDTVSLLRDRVKSFEEYPFSIPAIRHTTTDGLVPPG